MNDWHSIFRMLGALFAVVVLAWSVARLMQRRQAGGGAGRRLAVTEVLAIDPRRRLLLILCDGREALLAVLEPVNWFGEIGVFDRQPRTHDARADGHTTLLHMPQAALIALLDGSPALLHAFALLLTHKLRLTFIVLEETALLPAPVRVARRLLLMADGYGDLRLGTRRVLHVPQEQLAQLLSLSRQTVNQVLKEFEAHGILRLAYGEIELLDFAGLHRLAYEVGRG
jgi:CRP-like cAMP-binding protein